MTKKRAEEKVVAAALGEATPTQASPKLNGSAVVVGASLAGLMVSIALARVGVQVTIVERAAATPRNGAVLQVDSGETDHSAPAQVLRKLASGGLRSAEAWTSIQARLRAEVEAEPRIDLRYDTRIQEVGQDARTAWAVTEQGETVRGDILIGADGHRSTVRRQVAPHKPDATFAGYLIWVAIVEEQAIPEKYRPGPNAPLAMPNGIGDFLLGSVIAGSDGAQALGQRRLGWAWYDNTRNELLRQLGCVKGNVVHHSLVGPTIPEATLRELVTQATARWPQPWLAATLHSLQTRNLVGIPIAEYVPDQLVRGRIALVGDAAHVLTPLTAAGFNASLQDAATLADCVAQGRANADVAAALLAYEARRLKTVRQLVQSGQSFSRSFGR